MLERSSASPLFLLAGASVGGCGSGGQSGAGARAGGSGAAGAGGSAFAGAGGQDAGPPATTITVLNGDGTSLLSWPATMNADVAPSATISGPLTGLAVPSGAYTLFIAAY